MSSIEQPTRSWPEYFRLRPIYFKGNQYISTVQYSTAQKLFMSIHHLLILNFALLV
jgi:hypothetical protein